jgi:hypothetical protein
MLAIVWDPNDFHLIGVMPKRKKYSARCDIDNVLAPICQQLIPAGKCAQLLLVPHCQSALDFVSQRKVRFAPYPPDITPSNLGLFGSFKHELQGSRFPADEELLAEARKLVGEISPETWLDVFHDSIAWCEIVMGATLNTLSNGDICFV